jgi:anaerobic selenocysteine-containing dehydrogenase
MQHIFNSSVNDAVTNAGRPYNPAWLHPDDMVDLGLLSGDLVDVVTPRATIHAVVEPDPDLLPGLVATTFGFGGGPDRDDEFREIGSSPGRLLDGADLADPYAGMPRTGDIAVTISPRPSKRVD